MARYTKGGDVVRVPQINSELEKIEQAFEDMLSRKGDAPNQMEAPLDMNGQRLLNLPAPTGSTDPVRLRDVEDLVFQSQLAYVQETIPTDPQISEGSRWYVPSLATTFIYYTDDSGDGFWVEEPVAVADSVEQVSEFTTTSLIANTDGFDTGTVLNTTGYTSVGDGAGSFFVATSTTGLPVSQDFADTGALYITDGTGRRWDLVVEGSLFLETLGVAGDGVADDTTLVQLAIDSGFPVKGDKTSTYKCNNLTAANNLDIDFQGATLDARSFSLVSVSGARISNCTFTYTGVDTGYAWMDMTAASDCEIENCEFDTLPSSALATITLLDGASSNTIRNCYIHDDEQSGIAIDGSGTANPPEGNKVLNTRFESCTAFGIRLKQATDNEIAGCYTITGTILELVGLQAGADYNIVRDNIAQLTTDNGISISGDNNTVVGNICRNNDKAGIWLWGSFNTVTGNICKNNVEGGEQWAGIGVSANFGGLGQYNVITGNILDDDQASPTQENSLRFAGTAYVNWANGQVIDTSGGNVYRVNGLNLYIATTSGTTGATPPTHTSGTVSDGGVSWRYEATFISEADAVFNRASPNTIGRSAATSVVDATGKNKYNDEQVNYIDGDIRLRPDSGSTAFIRAEGDATNIDIRIAPKGAGAVSYGTHAAIGAETLTGYISIKDSSGVVRKIGVVS